MNQDEPSKSEVAYLALKHAVIEQALTPGTKLPEDTLAAHLNVSRTLVREALARLIAEGLVDAGRRRTATVAQPSRAEAHNVFEARACLEREVVRVVIERWTPSMGGGVGRFSRSSLLMSPGKMEQARMLCLASSALMDWVRPARAKIGG